MNFSRPLSIVAVAGLALCTAACGGSSGGKGDAGGTDTDGAGDGDGDGDVDLTEPGQAGERLQLRLRGVEGAMHPEGFYDTELDIDCNFLSTDEGLYCLPHGGGANFFADANCEVPLHTGASGCAEVPNDTEGQLVSVAEYSCGDGLWTAHRLGPLHTGPVYMATDAGCVEDMNNDPNTSLLFTLEDVDLSMFVAGERVIRGDADARVVSLEGEDGSRRTAGLANADGETCFGTDQFASGGPRCLPEVRAYATGNDYADATCSDDALAGYTTFEAACGFMPERLLRYLTIGNESCDAGVTIELREVGDPLDSAYSETGNGCEPITGDSRTFFTLGDAIDATTLPGVVSVARGNEVQARYWGPDADTPGTYIQLFRQNGETCGSGRTDDGKTRCLPQNRLGFADPTHFSDAGCTQGVIAWGFDCAEQHTHAERRELPMPGACFEHVTEMYELSPYTGTLYQGTPGSCAEVAPSPGDTYLALGDAVDPKSFPEIVTVRQ